MDSQIDNLEQAMPGKLEVLKVGWVCGTHGLCHRRLTYHLSRRGTECAGPGLAWRPTVAERQRGGAAVLRVGVWAARQAAPRAGPRPSYQCPRSQPHLCLTLRPVPSTLSQS